MRADLVIVSLSTSCWGAEESLLTLAVRLPGRTRIHAPAGALLDRAHELGLEARVIDDPAVLRLSDVGTTVGPRQLPTVTATAARALAKAELWDAGAVVSFSQWLHLPLALAGRTRRKRVVLDLHDGPFTSAGAAMQSSAAWTASGVVAVSQTSLRHLRTWPHGRTTVVPRPVALPDGVGPVAHATEGPLRLVIVGRLDPEKRVELALEAHARLVAEGVEVYLDVVGGAHNSAAGGELATAYPSATFHGRLDHESSLRRIEAADVLLSLAPGEAFGRTVAEAALLEVPAVVAATGGPAELVRDGVTGWVVPPDDLDGLVARLRTLASDRSVLAPAGRASRAELGPRCEPDAVAQQWYAAVTGSSAGTDAPVPRGSRAVFLTKQLPYPADSGGRLRSAAMVEVFRRHFDEVHVLGFGDQPAADLVPAGVHVHAVESGDNVRGTLRARSIAVGRWYSPTFRALVDELATPGTHVHVDFAQMAVNVSDPTRIDSLDMHNVEGDLLALRGRAESRQPQRAVLAVEAKRLRGWERRVARTPFVTCVSEVDRERFASMGVTASVLPNGTTLPADPTTPDPASTDMVFVGALDWEPNAEGVLWFAREVWPLVVAARPDAHASIVGRNPTQALRDLRVEGLEVIANVPSVRPYYDRAAFAVCPLLTGGGSRLKIVEALGHGRGVVSTPLGAEGLEPLHGRGIVLSTTAREFADRVLALLADPPEAARLGEQGRVAVAEQWSWNSTLADMDTTLSDWITA